MAGALGRTRFFFGRDEVHRGGVDAVALAGRVGAVIENMAEVAVTFFAGDLDANHAEAGIGCLFNSAIDRLENRWPSAAGVVLRLGEKQLRAAGFADVGAILKMMIILAGECSLGAFQSDDAVFFRGQNVPPFGLCLNNSCRSDFGWFHNRFMLNRLNGLGRRPRLWVDVGEVNWLRHRLGLGRRCGWDGF